jgi:G3E family GTPase
LADPGAIAAALVADPVLARRLAVTRILVLVDALHGTQQLAAGPIAQAQAKVADEIVITKPVAAGPAPE